MNGSVGQTVVLASDASNPFIKKRLALTLLLVRGTTVFAGLAPIALKYAVDDLGGERWRRAQAADAEMRAVLGPTIVLLI